jgi:hypothetical protein
MLSGRTSERGASVLIVASMMLVLLGMAAIAIDIGAGFNERRQNQTSADVGVLAGALDFFAPGIGVCGGAADGGCDELLTYVRANLSTSYTDAEWANIWRGCSDPNKPAGFGPVRADTTDPLWTGFSGTRADGTVFPDTVDCISRSGSELRVRVPDQLLETSFGRILDVDELVTNAVAQARVVAGGGLGAVVPFGVLNGARGYDCLLQPAAGISEEPCVGGSSGNYGAIFSQTWGSEETHTDCSTNQWGPEIRINTALGLDHFLEAVRDTSALPLDVNTFDTQLGQQNNYPAVDEATLLDRCTVVNGEVIPWDQTVGSAMDVGVPNTVQVDRGADAGDDTFKGLVIGTASDFPNAKVPSSIQPRLVFSAGSCTDANDTVSPVNGVSARCLDLGSYGTYVVDDAPIWEWILGGVSATDFTDPDNPSIKCSGAIDNAQTVDCILRSPDLSGPIFSEDIVKSRRFVWTPEFYYDEWGSGAHWQPIIGFKANYLHGLWISSQGPGLRLYEPGTNPGQINVTNPNAMKAMSSFILPSVALPANVSDGCPICSGADLEPELSK